MNATELMALQQSSQAPFNHKDYTIWLHNKIVERIRYDIHKFAEQQKSEAVIPSVLLLPCLKIIQ